MPVPLTTALLVIGAVLSPISVTACCIAMGLALLNQVIVEVAAFASDAPVSQKRISGDDDGLG